MQVIKTMTVLLTDFYPPTRFRLGGIGGIS